MTSLSLGIVLGDTGGLAILAVDATNTQLDVGFREIDGTWTIQGDGSQVVNKTLKEAEAIFRSFSCDGIKTIQVSDSNPNLAHDVVFNGSIASAIQVLNAYGVKNLPLETANVSSYDYWKHFPGKEYFWDSNEKMYIDAWTHASLTGEKKPSEIKEEERELSDQEFSSAPDTIQNEVNLFPGYVIPAEIHPEDPISIGVEDAWG